MGTTQSKSLAARHGMSQLAFMGLFYAAWQRPYQAPFRCQYYQQIQSGDYQLISFILVF